MGAADSTDCNTSDTPWFRGSSKQRLACHHIQRINSPFLKEAGGTAFWHPVAEQPHEPNEIGLGFPGCRTKWRS